MSTTEVLKAPFPWFGGKSRVAHLVWERFGDVANYVEPFAGSLATLLARPHDPRAETVNDIDCYISNFWRSMQADPELVADHANWPVNEADLHARHQWLVDRVEFRERMKTDPDYFDAKIAGWWVWGISQWIGGEWCSRPEWRGRFDLSTKRGIHGVGDKNWRKRPSLRRGGRGVHGVQLGGVIRKRPMTKMGMVGVHAKSLAIPRRRPVLKIGVGGVQARRIENFAGTKVERRRPHLTAPMGVQQIVQRRRPALIKGTGVHRQLPDISGASGAFGRGVHRVGLNGLTEYFELLAARLRRVRVCCGNWDRILSPSATWKIGTTAVFLDPPYGADADRDPGIYSEEDLTVAVKVREWAIANGSNPKLRIALCGYEGEHSMPADWSVVAWKTGGGYGNQNGKGRGKANATRERIWFSPYCLVPEQPMLF